MTKIEALGALLDMAEKKVAIYDAVSDPKQRAALKKQIVSLTWALTMTVSGTDKEWHRRVNALERRFPL